MSLNINTYDSIKNHEFYFAGFNQLNDPYELSIVSDNPERSADIAVSLIIGKNPNGIFCLSENWDNLLMWQHYADGHTGLVVELETDNDPIFFRELIKVRYAESPAQDHDTITVKELIEVKHIQSSYEKEWRVFGLKGMQKLNPSAIVSVTLGFRGISSGGQSYMLTIWPREDFYKLDSEKQKSSIRAALREHLIDHEREKKIKLFFARPDRHNFKILRDEWVS